MAFYNNGIRRCEPCKRSEKQMDVKNIDNSENPSNIKKISVVADLKFLGNNLTHRLLMPKSRTKFCASHQRIYSKYVKVLRILGFLNY